MEYLSRYIEIDDNNPLKVQEEFSISRIIQMIAQESTVLEIKNWHQVVISRLNNFF